MGSHRLLPFAALFTLALATISTSAAQSQSAVGTLPYVYSNYTFPSARASIARHTLRLAIPATSNSVSGLKLTAPAGFTLNRQVEVFNHQTGESLPVNVIIAGQTVELSFDRAVEPGTAIDIDLNNVSVWGTARYYDLAVKFAGDRYISLDRASLRRS